MNITDQADAGWPDANEMLSLIIDSISEVAWAFDPIEKRLVHVTSSVERLHDYSPQEFLKLPLSSWMSPDSVEKMNQLIAEQLPHFIQQGIQPKELIELELLRKDGSVFFAEISYKGYVHQPSGKVYVLGATRDITKRKIAEENARKSFAMLQGATRLVNLGAWEFDVQSGLYNVSPEWMDIYGFFEGEFDGTFEQILERVHPEDVERIQRVTDEVFLKKNNAPVDFRIIRKSDGSVRYLSLDSHLQLCPKGNLKRIYGVVNDITKNVLAEKERRENEENNKLFAELTQEGISIQRDGVMLDFNNRFCEIFGYTRSEISEAESLVHLFHCGDVDIIRQKIQTRNTERYRVRGVRSDGKVLWLDMEAKYMIYKGEEARVTFIQDISEKMVALTNLADSEERNRVIVDNMPLACFAFDKEGTILSWNKEAQKIYGYSQNEAIGNSGLELIGTPEIAGKIKEIIDGVFDGATQKSNEWNDKDKHGRLGWRFGNSFPIFNENGEVVYGMNMVMDVSDLKQANAELEMHKEHLEKLVNERTQQLKLANEDLTKLNQSLNLANQALTCQQAELETALNDLKNAQVQLVQSEKLASLGTLTAGVAHEINNPLNFIHGGAVGLQLHCEGSKDYASIVPFLDAINEGVRRVSSVVTSLSKFNIVQNSAGGNVQINELIDSCITMVKGKHGCNISFEKHYEDTDAVVVGAEGELYQAMLNILTNAEEAINDSGVISVYTGVVARKFIRIAIQDNGKGIGSETMSRIYDPFYTVKRREKNAGLGLYIAKSIIESHGGSIDVKSQEGEGTLVEVLLPVFIEEGNYEEGKNNTLRR